MSFLQVVLISAIWLVAGIRIGWLICDYRQHVQRINREMRR